MAARSIVILLVEDNPADVRLAQETLKDYKIQNQLHVVRDGEEALDFLCKQGKHTDAPDPDMVLLDLNLPKMDGFEVMDAMQKSAALRSIPIVVLTASPVDSAILQGYDIPTDCFIQKPLTLDRYLDAVRCFEHLGLAIVKTAGS